MARQFQNRPSFPRRKRANRSWAGVISAASTPVGPNTKVLLATFVLSNPNIDETVLRTVGSISVATDQSAAGEDQIGAFGLILVTDLAVAAGIASIPDPVTNVADDGWFVFVPIVQHFRFVDASGVLIDSMRYDFDSKAKRRVEEGQAVAVVVANGNASHGFNISVAFRLLSQI